MWYNYVFKINGHFFRLTLLWYLFFLFKKKIVVGAGAGAFSASECTKSKVVSKPGLENLVPYLWKNIVLSKPIVRGKPHRENPPRLTYSAPTVPSSVPIPALPWTSACLSVSTPRRFLGSRADGECHVRRTRGESETPNQEGRSVCSL